MPVPHARLITLTTAERRRLTALTYSRTAAYQQVIRARIVCDAARGHSNAAIARRHEVTVDTVRRWRNRFADDGIAGLSDRPRPGRPPRLTPVQAAEITALACQLPAETGTPLSKWSCPDLATEAVNRSIVAAISASTNPPDPRPGHDQALAAPVLDLHPRPAVRRQSRPRARPLRP